MIPRDGLSSYVLQSKEDPHDVANSRSIFLRPLIELRISTKGEALGGTATSLHDHTVLRLRSWDYDDE